jgi:CubicO group peptidase (beta-lactamase class C family)
MCRLRRFAPLLCSGLLLSACSHGDPVDYDWTALSETLDGFVDPQSPTAVPGYSFALAIGGELVFEQAGGNLDTASQVPIASATKAPTAAAILTLVQDGNLDLDKPVHEYLGPLWPASGPRSLITTRMLLNHTSGLPFTANCLDDILLTTIVECVSQIAQLSLQFTPGERFLYSAAGYQVAGLVAERISGQGWNEFFESRFASRLGLRDYAYLGNGNPRLAGGAISSAADYLKIQQLVLDRGRAQGERLLPASLTDLMRVDQIAGLPVDFTPIPEGAGLNGYSFGWWISDAGLPAPSRGPEISDPGVLGTVPWMDFDKNYAAIILIEADGEAGLRLFNALRPLIVAQIDHPGPKQAVADGGASIRR